MGRTFTELPDVARIKVRGKFEFRETSPMESIQSEFEKTIESNSPVSLSKRKLLPGNINFIDVRVGEENLSLSVLRSSPPKIVQNQALTRTYCRLSQSTRFLRQRNQLPMKR